MDELVHGCSSRYLHYIYDQLVFRCKHTTALVLGAFYDFQYGRRQLHYVMKRVPIACSYADAILISNELTVAYI
jgi:hypothetical protein